jgi:hypothetical protein
MSVDLEWREYLILILSCDKYVLVKAWGLAVYSSQGLKFEFSWFHFLC